MQRECRLLRITVVGNLHGGRFYEEDGDFVLNGYVAVIVIADRRPDDIVLPRSPRVG